MLTAYSIDPHLFLRHRAPCHGRLACDLQALTLPEFVDPLLFGLIASAAGFLLCLGLRRTRRKVDPLRAIRPLPIGGLLFAAATLAAYQHTGHLVVGLGLSIILLVAGGLIGQIARLPSLPRMALTVPGAIVLGMWSALPDPRWARVFAAIVTVIASGLIDSLDSRGARLGLGPILLGVTFVGLYETVPDPDFALLLVGAALPLSLLAWPLPLVRLGSPGAAAAAGFLAWADAVGGRGRLGTVVAGAACLGLFAIEPIAHLILRGRSTILERLPARWWAPATIAFVQLGLVALCTRIALGETSPAKAAVISALALVLAVFATLVVSERHVNHRHLTPRSRRVER